MRADSPAPAIVRSLLAVERSAVSGVLEVRCPGKTARIGVVDGVPRAIALTGQHTGGAAAPLGDVLDAAGAFDHDAHAAALTAGEPAEPIGMWLVRHAVCTQAAIDAALLSQFTTRLAAVLAFQGAQCRFWPGDGDVGVPALFEAYSVADLVGRAKAHLSPEEAEGLSLTHGRDRGPSYAPRGYALLLRKHRQVSRGEGAHVLLELAPGASAVDTRRALRRIARDVHPDRFEGAAPEVQSAAHEVMTALLEAERQMLTAG